VSAVVASAAAAAAPDVYRQLGQITRQLHDTLTELGVMPQLQRAAQGLPDARSRLHYVAQKTGAAADRVLDAVEHAKREQAHIVDALRRLAPVMADDPARAALMEILHGAQSASTRLDAHLTDIMLAQDFHDLTGQVVGKVVGLAGDIEASLVELLVQAAPAPLAPEDSAGRLNGPVIDAQRRGADVVADQGEVDDLLASLGF
jgi:chemotaxis protein CheZ